MPVILKVRRGDTLIEVAFAIAVFALVSLLSIAIMNTGVTMTETSLESTMTRNEIDAQAEAIRFLHNSYLSEKELVKEEQEYRDIWTKITKLSVSGSNIDKLPANFESSKLSSCNAFYDESNSINIFKKPYYNAFVINTRKVTNDFDQTVVVAKNDKKLFAPATLNPRIIFKNNKSTNDDANLSETNTVTNAYDTIARVEGIWVIAVRSNADTDRSKSEYYDFHIRSCWYAPGQNTPSTIATIVRLYNPDFVK